jgi:hypothetical protein
VSLKNRVVDVVERLLARECDVEHIEERYETWINLITATTRLKMDTIYFGFTLTIFE